MNKELWTNTKKIKTTGILQEFIEENYSKEVLFLKKKPSRLNILANYLEQAVKQTRPNNQLNVLYESVVDRPQYASTFQKTELYRKLGYRYKEAMDVFFNVSPYHRKRKLTRGYSLKIPVIQKLSSFIKDSYNNPIQWESTKGRRINSIPRGILKTTENKKKAITSIDITGEIPVNLKAIEEVILTICSILEKQKIKYADRSILDKYNISLMMLRFAGNEYYLNLLYSLYLIYRLSLMKNCFPQFYIESNTGRIAGVGFNLQNTAGRLARNISLVNMDMYDYDMETSTPSIYYALAKKYKMQARDIEQYINNKKYYRDKLANDIGVSVKRIKKAMNANFYGVGDKINIKEKFRTKLVEILGSVTKAEEFLNEPFVKSLRGELDNVRNEIIKRLTIVKGRTFVNAIGKSNKLIYQGRGKKLDTKKLSAYIIFGYEALITQTAYHVLKDMGCKTYLLISDGFIAEKADVRELEKKVMQKLKKVLPHLELKFSMEELKTT